MFFSDTLCYLWEKIIKNSWVLFSRCGWSDGWLDGNFILRFSWKGKGVRGKGKTSFLVKKSFSLSLKSSSLSGTEHSDKSSKRRELPGEQFELLSALEVSRAEWGDDLPEFCGVVEFFQMGKFMYYHIVDQFRRALDEFPAERDHFLRVAWAPAGVGTAQAQLFRMEIAEGLQLLTAFEDILLGDGAVKSDQFGFNLFITAARNEKTFSVEAV